MKLTAAFFLLVSMTTLAAGISETSPKKIWSIFLRYSEYVQDSYLWMTNLGDPDLYQWIDDQNARTDLALGHRSPGQDRAALEADLDLEKRIASKLSDLYAESVASTFDQSPIPKIQPFVKQRKLQTANYSLTTYPVASYGDLKNVVITNVDNNENLGTIFSIFGSVAVFGEDVIYVTHRDHRHGGASPALIRHSLSDISNREDEVLHRFHGADSFVVGYFDHTKFYFFQSQREQVKTGYYDLESMSYVETQTLAGAHGYVGIHANTRLTIGDVGPYFGKLVVSDLATGQISFVGSADDGTNWSKGVVVGDSVYLVGQYQATNRLHRVDLSTRTISRVTVEDAAQIELFNIDNQLTVATSTAQIPLAVSRLDPVSHRLEVVDSYALPMSVLSETVYYTAHNGDDIPIFLTYQEGTVLSSETPIYQYGYGGFGVSLAAGFGSLGASWYGLGGVHAVVILPGGGEFGEEWREAGMLYNKMNVFEDFARASQRLIDLGYTSPQKLAIAGESNGGLLAAMTAQLYPERFAAALPGVAVLDMIDFQNWSAGRFWTADYGDSKIESEFLNQLSISPYHQIQAKAYPAMFVDTGDYDDRVVPHHAYRYVAKMIDNQQGNGPIYLHTVRGGNHSWRGNESERMRFATNRLAFLRQQLAID